MRDIEFHSLCEHHLLPFHGTVHVGYLPAGKIIGLSKIPRIVERQGARAEGSRGDCRQKQRSSTITRAIRGAHEEILSILKGS